MKKLEDIKKDNLFEVPEGYFDSFPEKIMSRIKDEEQTANKPAGKAVKMLKSYVFLAAALIIFVIIGRFAISLIENDQEKQYNAEEMLSAGIYEIDESLIMENWIEAEDIAEDTVKIDEESEEIIDYLMEGDIDEYVLLAEL